MLVLSELIINRITALSINQELKVILYIFTSRIKFAVTS